MPPSSHDSVPGQVKMRRREFVQVLAGAPLLAAGGGSILSPLLRLFGGDLPGSADHMALYCVGYAHLDTEWRWSYPIVIREYIRNTMERNFPLFEKYPHYIFNFTGANRYRLMQEYYPELFARVKHYVGTGQWFPAGSSWEEGIVDEPSSESVVRQVLYGNRYFRRQFGKASNEFMLPDSFGFPASLPSLLAHAGLKGFSTQKLTWGSAVGIPFNLGVWVGPDGRGVVAALNGTNYTGKVREDLSHDPKWIARVKEDGDRCGVYLDYRYYGVGDKGGTPGAESAEWIEKSLAGGGPLHIVSATGAQLFDDITEKQVARLPRYQGDLLLTNHSAGTPSSQGFMKKLNRKNEFRADEAERASVAADLLGGPAYPREQITVGWQMLLAGQFHDILAGTCKPDAYHYAWNDGFIARNQLTQARDSGVGAVARALDTQGGGIPLVIYNPLSTEREDVVEAEVDFGEEAPEAVIVLGPDGSEIPAQVAAREGRRGRLLLLARVPSVGFAVFTVRPATGGAPAGSELKVDSRRLENTRYIVTLQDNGDVANIHDKRAGRDLLAGPGRLAFLRENPAQYPAWNMDFGDALAPPFAYVDGDSLIEVVESGPARVAVRVTRQAQGSAIVQTIRLAGGGAADRVEFDTFIDWHTPAAALKAVFPLTVSNPKATYNWEAGTVERATDNPKCFEWPSHQWFDLTDAAGGYGVSVLEDCKYGSDKPNDNTLRLTLMYTPGLENIKRSKDGKQSFGDQATQDFGRHQFTYALMGHAGDWREGGTHWQAARLNQPMTAFQDEPHPGGFGKSFSLLRVESAQVMVKALKKAEESDEIIVRLQELSGRPAPGVALSLPGAAILSAREVDGQERPAGDAILKGGKLHADFGAYRLQAFALKIGAPAARIAGPSSQPLDLPFDLIVTSRDHEKSPGGIDRDGRCLPAEQFPAELICAGVRFRLGPATGKNALSCQGQSIPLLPGYRRLCFLATAAGGPAQASFGIDGRLYPVTVADWGGFIGQPDYRVWDSSNYPEVAPVWNLAFKKVAPGYLRPDPLAWFCSHRHSASGENEIYDYCYVYRYWLDLPPGARALTLPADSRIVVLAASLASEAGDGAVAVSPDLGVF